jgi:ABC-type multidrug transport system ATPase subunit
MTTRLFKEKCGLVSQEDYHWTFLTCRETIAYAADLLNPEMSSEQKKLEVDSMLEKMGLVSCKDTMVGNAFIHGLSGGQKRRLSVAVALMKKLELVFLDEPTSGLDAAAAAGIMVFLADVTKKENLVTVFTVHQPSTTIFNNFDRVMLLSKGRTAFCGRQKDVVAHLQAISFPLPPQTNPAEFLLDIVNTDFTDDIQVNKILDDWNVIGKPDHDKRIDAILSSMTKVPVSNGVIVSETNLIYQTYVMVMRHSILAVRDPLIYTGRCVLFFFATIFFAIIYVKSRLRYQEQALQHNWFIIWCIGVPSNMGVVAVYIFNTEFFAIKREVKNGMVSSIPYLFANSLIQIPVMFIFGLSALPVAAYAIMNYQGAHFGQVWLIYALTMYSFESMAQLLAVAFSNPLLGMLQYVNLWFAAFLFCGLFLPITDIIWPLRIFSYIMPYRYAFQAFAYQEYHGTTWRDAEPCVYVGDDTCNYGGFRCTKEVQQCFGYTGDQVLSTINLTFATINENDNFGAYIGVLIAIAICCKFGFVIMMYFKTREASKVEAATNAPIKAPVPVVKRLSSLVVPPLSPTGVLVENKDPSHRYHSR